jgi:hypothetical protein
MICLSRVFVAMGGVSELTPPVMPDDAIRTLIERMLVFSLRRADLSKPSLSTHRLPRAFRASASPTAVLLVRGLADLDSSHPP